MKVLVIRFSSIGDIVLTTPVIRCLKQQVEGIEVHFLTKKAFASIVETNPYLDKVFLLENSLPNILSKLKNEKYDLIVDLHHNLRTLRVKQSLGVTAKAFDKLNVEKWLMTRFKVDKLPSIQIVDRYLETIKHLEVVNDNKGLDFFIAEKDQVEPNTLSPKLTNSYVAFAIGAQHATKRLPTERIISICQKIEKPVVLLGGKDDMEASQQIARACPNVIDTCGKMTIGQSASLVQQASHVISHDTGMMHIAAAFKKHIISIWGNTIPEFGMYPYLPNGEGQYTIVEVKGLSCRPCSKIGYDKCPKGHFKCMQEIDEEVIINQVN